MQNFASQKWTDMENNNKKINEWMQNIFTSRINIKVTINVAFNVFEDVFIDLSSVLMNMFESKQRMLKIGTKIKC